MSANQQMLLQVLDMGLGFELDAIQSALVNTGNTSAEAAINYLLQTSAPSSSAAAAAPSSAAAAPSGGGDVSMSDADSNAAIEELKRALSGMNFDCKESQYLRNALSQNDNNSQKALQWLLDKHPDQLVATDTYHSEVKTAADAEQLKLQMEKAALQKQQERDMEDKKRTQELERQKREFEEAQRERERKKQAQLQKMKENRQRKKRQADKTETARKTKLLGWHKQQEKYEEKEEKIVEEMQKNRSRSEMHITSPDKALETIMERQGDELGRQSLELMQKILLKIEKNPNEPKFRHVNLGNRKIHMAIETPLGGVKFFKFLGFKVELTADDLLPDITHRHLVLTDSDLNVNTIESGLSVLKKYLTRRETAVVAVVTEMEKTMVDSGEAAEDLYCAVMTLHDILRNIIINPDSEALRFVNVDEFTFKQRVGRFPKMIGLMKSLGFKLEKRLRSRVLALKFDQTSNLIVNDTHPQIKLMKAACYDLSQAAIRTLPKTNIGKGVTAIRQSSRNAGENVEKLLNTMVTALSRILEQPLEMKYQSISLDKLNKKYPGVSGVASLMKVTGFVRSQKNVPLTRQKSQSMGIDDSVTITKKNVEKIFELRKQGDFDLLRLRRNQLRALTYSQ